MEALPHTHHLLRRNGIWSYRRRVPTHLVEAFGKPVIQYSLRTSSLKDAKKLRAAEDLKWDIQFETAATELTNAGAPRRSSPPITAARRSLSAEEVIVSFENMWTTPVAAPATGSFVIRPKARSKKPICKLRLKSVVHQFETDALP